MNLWQFMLQNHTEILELTLEHLWLVGISTLLAVLVGIPLGILITRWPALNKPVLGGANIIQTIPSLALFGFLLPAPWIGERADRLVVLMLDQHLRPDDPVENGVTEESGRPEIGRDAAASLSGTHHARRRDVERRRRSGRCRVGAALRS